MSEWIEVAPVADWPTGGLRVVDVDGVSVIVVHVNGGFHAVEDLCTHDGAPLSDGLVSGAEIICPRHGARFCLRTGKALCPPAYEPIATFPVKVENGRVLVRDARQD